MLLKHTINMIKQAQIKNSVAKSGFILIVGGLLCKLIGAFYRIPLSNLLGAEGIGIYQIIYPIYSFTLVLVSGGLTLAVSKLTSRELALGKKKQILKHFFSALLFAVIFGGVVLFLFFILAKPISTFQEVGNSYLSYYLVGASVFFAATIACFRGLFQGFSNMSSTVISQLIEQIFKFAIGLFLVYRLMPFGIDWAVLGAFIGLAVSEFLALTYYIIISVISIKKGGLRIYKSSNKTKRQKLFSTKVLKLAFPITLSQLMLPLALGLQSLFVVKILTQNGLAQNVAKSQFGILSGMVNSLINFPSVFSVSLGVILVSSVSFLMAKNKQNDAGEVVGKIYKTLWIISLPCSVGFFMLSENILGFVFFQGLGKEYLSIASLLLKVASLQIVFVSFVQITTVLMQVLNKTWIAFFSLVSFFVLSSVLSFVLTSNFGILGLATANLLAYGFTCVVNIFVLRNKLSAKIKIKDILIPFILSVIMGIIIYISKLILLDKIATILFLIIVLALCVIFYFGFLIVFKVFKIKDLLPKKIKSA
jgi:stage V sporulation protein B